MEKNGDYMGWDGGIVLEEFLKKPWINGTKLTLTWYS